MGPELTGVFAMQKGAETAPYQTQEIYAFAATIDDEGRQRLRQHLSAVGLESVGVFKATGCDVFEDRMRGIDHYEQGTVFQVGHGATHNIAPRIVHTAPIDSPEDWQ